MKTIFLVGFFGLFVNVFAYANDNKCTPIMSSVHLGHNETLKKTSLGFVSKIDHVRCKEKECTGEGKYRQCWNKWGEITVYWKLGTKLPRWVRKKTERHFSRQVTIAKARNLFSSILGILIEEAKNAELHKITSLLRGFGFITILDEKLAKEELKTYVIDALIGLSLTNKIKNNKNSLDAIIYFGLTKAKDFSQFQSDDTILYLSQKMARIIKSKNDYTTKYQKISAILTTNIKVFNE